MWGMLAGAALGGLSGLFGGGGSQKKQEVTQTSPWGPQIPYLERGFAGAGSALDAWNALGPYQGNLYAGMNDYTKQGLRMGLNFARNGGADLQNQYLKAGLGMMSNGQSGMSSVADKMANFQTSGGVDSDIAGASKYAANPYMDSMIDAASRDVTRNLKEVQLPGINRSAVGSGNMNSSRAGVAEGIAMRGAQDSIADIAANLRGNAYQNGLQLAQNGSQFNDQMRMQGFQGAGNLYNSIFNGGLTAGGAAQGQADANSGAFTNAGDRFQADRQGYMNEDYTKYLMNRDYSFDGLDRYWNIIGSGNWGGTSVTNSKGGGGGGGAGGFLQGALGGALKGWGMS